MQSYDYRSASYNAGQDLKRALLWARNEARKDGRPRYLSRVKGSWEVTDHKTGQNSGYRFEDFDVPGFDDIEITPETSLSRVYLAIKREQGRISREIMNRTKREPKKPAPLPRHMIEDQIRRELLIRKQKARPTGHKSRATAKRYSGQVTFDITIDFDDVGQDGSPLYKVVPSVGGHRYPEQAVRLSPSLVKGVFDSALAFDDATEVAFNRAVDDDDVLQSLAAYRDRGEGGPELIISRRPMRGRGMRER